MNYIDLFAGAGGLSEGFIRAGFSPIAHIEKELDACKTLETRGAFHFLRESGKIHIYKKYLKKDIDREALLKVIPEEVRSTVINCEISQSSLDLLFTRIDSRIGDKKIDVLIGGPPCQAYSLVGRARDPNKMAADPRNYLFKLYGEFLKRYKPSIFIFENVIGLLSAGNYLEDMIQLFESKEVGYTVPFPEVLNAKNYGVLQDRKRVIIFGKKQDDKFTYPKLEKVIDSWQIQSDLFDDLPILRPGCSPSPIEYSKPSTDYLEHFSIRNGFNFVTQHITRPHNKNDLSIYKIAIEKWLEERKRLRYDELPKELMTHANTSSFLDRYKVVDPYGVSHTLVAHIAKDGHYYIHPDPSQNRSISVREAARIQSFPDDYYFEGSRTSAFKQIGNAVPPLFSHKIAQKVKEILYG